MFLLIQQDLLLFCRLFEKAPPRLQYDPTHPDANEEGYVAMPNISPVEEMVNLSYLSIYNIQSF